ncbi:MAG: hypothetical protein ACRBFS_23875 [Aureispira sp.]
MKRIKDRIAGEKKRQEKYQSGNKTTVLDGLLAEAIDEQYPLIA